MNQLIGFQRSAQLQMAQLEHEGRMTSHREMMATDAHPFVNWRVGRLYALKAEVAVEEKRMATQDRGEYEIVAVRLSRGGLSSVLCLVPRQCFVSRAPRSRRSPPPARIRPTGREEGRHRHGFVTAANDRIV
jgi:hypothetical protein